MLATHPYASSGRLGRVADERNAEIRRGAGDGIPAAKDQLAAFDNHIVRQVAVDHAAERHVELDRRAIIVVGVVIERSDVPVVATKQHATPEDAQRLSGPCWSRIAREVPARFVREPVDPLIHPQVRAARGQRHEEVDAVALASRMTWGKYPVLASRSKLVNG